MFGIYGNNIFLFLFWNSWSSVGFLNKVYNRRVSISIGFSYNIRIKVFTIFSKINWYNLNNNKLKKIFKNLSVENISRYNVSD